MVKWPLEGTNLNRKIDIFATCHDVSGIFTLIGPEIFKMTYDQTL